MLFLNIIIHLLIKLKLENQLDAYGYIAKARDKYER